VANLRRRIRDRSAQLDRDVHAYRALTGADLDDADLWGDSYGALRTSNPRRVQNAINNHVGTHGRDHPAVQSMQATLDYLRGRDPGPRPELVELVRRRGGPVYARWYELDGGQRRQGRIINPLPSAAGSDYRRGRTFDDLELAAVGTQPRDARWGRRGYGNDESLEVAAPDARVRVDAPVRNVTDPRAQQSQYDIGQYAQNAGDGKAKPVLETDSQIWPPGVGAQGKKGKVDATLAMRCAQAHMAAGLPCRDKWQLIANIQRLPRATVIDRMRLLEAIAEANATRARSARRRTAGRTRACSAPLLRYGGTNTASTADWALFV
jgi:hypothetical protein